MEVYVSKTKFKVKLQGWKGVRHPTLPGMCVSAPSHTNSRLVCAPNGNYASTKWTRGRYLGIATWFKSRNQIGHFGPLTYMHRSTYPIVGFEFGYDLRRCQAPKTTWLVIQPSLCVTRPCLNKEVIKRVIILNPKRKSCTNEKISHNMLNITSQQKRENIKTQSNIY